MKKSKNHLSKTQIKAYIIKVTNSNNGITTQAIHFMKR